MNKYVIISASTRSKSESLRLSGILEALIRSEDPEAVTNILNLAVVRHMDWNEQFWGEEIPCPEWKRSSAMLHSASAFIFVVPEWHGMVPPALTNLLILAERHELAHKPALIVSISSGNGGAYVVSQLKANGSKNNRLCFIPDHVIIRNIKNKAFNGDDDSSGDFARLKYATNVLKAYIPALQLVRESGVLDFETWPYGM